MWEVQYSKDIGQNSGNYTLSRISEDDETSKSSTYIIPLTGHFQPTKSVYDIIDDVGARDELLDVRNDDETNAYSWIGVEDTSKIPAVESVSVSDVYQDVYNTSAVEQNQSFHKDTDKIGKTDKYEPDTDTTSMYSMSLIYGHNGSILLACIVRVFLIGHSFLTVWHVTNYCKESLYWFLAIANFFLVFEGIVVIIRNAGREYSWWSPCVLIYMASTVPAVWLLHLNQYQNFTSADEETLKTSLDSAQQQNVYVWSIVIEETLVCMLLFSRWLLPRGKLSQDIIADLLLEFLVRASDIMELLAVFDEDQVRRNLKLTYAIMAVWSASLIQFIPIFMRRNRYRNVYNVECLTRYCGNNIVEIVAICMSIFLQDLPFLVVRLYLIINMKLITYSLIFFLLKNIIILLLLIYRLAVLTARTLYRRT